MFDKVRTVDFSSVAIPELPVSAGWKEVPIVENGEPLVLLNGMHPKILVASQYHLQGIPFATPEQFARQGVADRLVEAARILPDETSLVIWDAWRSLEVQQSLFDTFKEQLHQAHEDWDDERLITETQTYVSLPSRVASRPSPHNTGGAIDLSLCDMSGNPLPMGVPFDHFGPESAANYLESHQDSNGLSPEARANRRILYHAMTQAGFSSYHEEIWHFDFGNQFDAVRKQTNAIYGAANPKS